MEKNYETLISYWYEGTKGLKTSTVEKLGFDINEKEIQIGNFLLKKNWLLGGYDFKLIDKNKDLLNQQYIDNKKANMFIKSLWKQGVVEVTSKELEPIFLNTRLGVIDLQNFKLKQIGISQSYRISLQDKEKGADGKWMNTSIDLSKILLVLQEYHLTNEHLDSSNETKLNGELENHFKKYFENVSKSSGKIRGLFDLVIGEMDFVIEVKLASSLKSSGQRQRASGQIKQYLEEIGSKNFLLLVIGSEKMKQEKNVKSLEKEVLEDFNCYFYYLSSK